MGESKFNKQILYPGFFVRVMSTFIDMCFATIIFMPISNFLRMKYFISKYGGLLANHDVDPKNFEAVVNFFSNPEIIQTIRPYDLFSAFIVSVMCGIVMPLFCYLTTSWYFWGTTPAKYLLSMKIVDEETLEKPKLISLIWRFLGYGFFFIGIWFIFFTKRNQAFHDKLGKTVVISS